MRGPTPGEDAKNGAVIGGSALAGVLATAAFLTLGGDAGPRVEADAASPSAVSVRIVRSGAPTVTLTTSRVRRAEAPSRRYELVEHKSGANRLFGTVRLAGDRGGAPVVRHGFLRWDRNEGSWGDPLNAVKIGDGRSQSTIRFGHVRRIERLRGNQARLVLRSGETVRFGPNGTDLGPSLRKLVVTGVNGRRAEFDWSDVADVTFDPAPAGAAPASGRLHGTLSTASGMEFTGFVAWDLDEILSSDVLDGDFQGERHEIPFGAVASISREGSRSARVVLHSGEELVLSGTNDVDRRNNGITVSDPALGAVNVSWKDFAGLVFHEAATEETIHDFDGGVPLLGTVATTSGELLSGRIKWDADEARSWETLDGRVGGTEFEIEFSKIAAIARSGDGATVTLRDGRAFHLSGSNDVDGGNRGIVVATEAGEVVVPWKDFAELSLRW